MPKNLINYQQKHCLKFQEETSKGERSIKNLFLYIVGECIYNIYIYKEYIF